MNTTIKIIALDGLSIRTGTRAGQSWVGGELGQRYAIQVTNDTRSTVLVVPTVDGKNTISGKPGSYDGQGMVLEPRATAVIDGWRVSLDEVAAFRISDVAESYAAKTGDAGNVGVIGVAVFGRKEGLRNVRPRTPTARPAAMGVTRSSGTRSAGTAFGEQHSSRVSTTTFDRAASPSEVHVIRYDTTENLIAAGILSAIEVDAPNPFPANPSQFCEAP